MSPISDEIKPSVRAIILMFLAIVVTCARDSMIAYNWGTVPAIFLVDLPFIIAIFFLPILCAGAFLSAVDYALDLRRGYAQPEAFIIILHILTVVVFLAWLFIAATLIILIITAFVFCLRLIWRMR